MADAAPTEFDIALPLTESPFDVPEHHEMQLGDGLEGDPAIAFRRTLGMFATGVTILTTRTGEQVHGMTANAFMSVSLRPPLVLISLDRRARLCALLHEGTRYGVSVLEAAQQGLSDRFAGRPGENLPEPSFTHVLETPLVEGALAHLVARVVRSYYGGDHSLFLGHVEYARYGEGRPLLFHGGRYERLEAWQPGETDLPAELVEPLLAVGTEVTYEDGDAMMRIGDPGDFVLLVLEGTAAVERPGVSLLLGEGKLIGEIEVLDPGAGRKANVTAVGRVRCVAVTSDELRQVLETHPRAGIVLLEILAARFRDAG